MPAANDIKPSTERALVIDRVFDAPRELVFKMWTDPEHMAKWWGPRDYPANKISADVRPGGKYRHCLNSSAGDVSLWLYGTFREIVPPERLVFTFAWEEEGERGLETIVTIDFKDEGQKTRMHFRQSPFQSRCRMRRPRDGLEQLVRPDGRLHQRFCTGVTRDHDHPTDSGPRCDNHARVRCAARAGLEMLDRTRAHRQVVGTEVLHQSGLRDGRAAGRAYLDCDAWAEGHSL